MPGRAWLFLSSVLALATSTPAMAQPSPASLASLKPKSVLRVLVGDSTRIEGNLVHAGADSLIIRSDTTLVSMSMRSIASVHRRGTWSGKGALVGCLLGATAGAFAGNAWGKSTDFIKPSSPAQGAVACGFFGAIAGAGLGAIAGTFIPRWHLVYRAGDEVATQGGLRGE